MLSTETKTKHVLDVPAQEDIRVRSCPCCYLCGAQGVPLYRGLQDRLFGAPGEWNFKRCPMSRCGLLWLDPMPLEEDIGKAYQTYYTHEDQAEPPSAFHRRIYRRIKNRYLARKYGYYRNGQVSGLDWLLAGLMYLHPPRRIDLDFSVFCLQAPVGGRLLEVGCGSGNALKSMQELGWDVEGVDFDSTAAEKARAKGLKVHIGRLSDQGFPEGNFDAAVMSHLVEHVPDPVGLFRECHRILKPGGHLVVITPNAASWGHRLYGSNWRGLEPPRHLHIFSPASLATAAERAGFAKIDCRSIPRGWEILLGSSRLSRRPHTGGLPRSTGEWLWAEVIVVSEWLRLFVDRNAGEEIALTAEKP